MGWELNWEIEMVGGLASRIGLQVEKGVYIGESTTMNVGLQSTA